MSTDDYPGEDKGAASLLFKNQNILYPEFKGKDLSSLYPGIQFQMLALDGATTAHVLHNQLRNIKASAKESILFTLTASGNDILLGEDADSIIFRLETILQNITHEFPNSDLIIGTTYDPTDGVKDLFEDRRDLTREYEILQIVNETIQGFQNRPKVQTVDIYSHFLGHGLHCKEENNPYYHKDDPSSWYVLRIEPNVRGAHEIRRLLWESLHPEMPALL